MRRKCALPTVNFLASQGSEHRAFWVVGRVYPLLSGSPSWQATLISGNSLIPERWRLSDHIPQKWLREGWITSSAKLEPWVEKRCSLERRDQNTVWVSPSSVTQSKDTRAQRLTCPQSDSLCPSQFLLSNLQAPESSWFIIITVSLTNMLSFFAWVSSAFKVFIPSFPAPLLWRVLFIKPIKPEQWRSHLIPSHHNRPLEELCSEFLVPWNEIIVFLRHPSSHLKINSFKRNSGNRRKKHRSISMP